MPFSAPLLRRVADLRGLTRAITGTPFREGWRIRIIATGSTRPGTTGSIPPKTSVDRTAAALRDGTHPSPRREPERDHH